MQRVDRLIPNPTVSEIQEYEEEAVLMDRSIRRFLILCVEQASVGLLVGPCGYVFNYGDQHNAMKTFW